MTDNLPVIFLPGLMQDARVFAPQVDSLSRDRAVMVVPTHLDDSIEDGAERVLQSAPQRFALVGTSLGGTLALEILGKAPERVDRICLNSMAAMSETPELVAQRDVQMASVRGGRFDDVMTEALALNSLPENQFRLEIVNMARAMAAALGPDAFLRQSQAMQRRRDHQSTLRKIQCPTLVLCGEADALYPLKRHQFMAEMIPRARLEIISSAAHLVTLEQPDAVDAILRDWLAA